MERVLVMVTLGADRADRRLEFSLRHWLRRRRNTTHHLVHRFLPDVVFSRAQDAGAIGCND
jgi:hypothetical protein